MAIEELRRITAAWLREAIDLEAVSPETVAERAGIAKSTVYRLLGGEVQPEETTIDALRGVLKHPYPTLSPIQRDRAASRSPAAEQSRSARGKGPLIGERPSSGLPGGKSSSAYVREQPRPGMPASSAAVDEGAVRIYQMLVDAVGSAVRKVIESNELDLTREGKRAIAEWLRQTARYFRHESNQRADVSDLYEMADQLLKELES